MLSNQPGADSAETSNIVTQLIYNIYSFLLPENYLIGLSEFLSRYVHIIRKIAHFSEYLILGILFYINFEELNNPKKQLYLSLLCSIAYAISDEIHQLFVLNRYCSFTDILIDSSGAVTGILIFHFLSKIWKKHSSYHY